LLESAPDRRLKPGRRFFERSVAGNVRAGVPNPAKTLLIKVKGDSIIDAGIHLIVC